MNAKLQINVILAITIAAIIHTATARGFDDKYDYITPCHLDDPHFNDCYTKYFQDVFHDLKDGVPGLNSVGSFDPMHIKRVHITQVSKSWMAFNADLSDITITGASNVVVKDASFNPTTLVKKVTLFFPKLHCDSDYKINGRVQNLVLNSKGKAEFEVEHSTMTVAIQFKLRDEHDYTYADIEKLRVDIKDIDGFHIHLDNLFNGDKALEESTNALFNENWRDFYEFLRPAISEAVEGVLLDRLKKIFSFIPAKFFIADLESAAKHHD